ncbi:MAG: DUF1272 domain-containing protein [Pseudomonadales bacterium]
MLDIRPNCECCDADLPPDSTIAMICTYECTFCATCVETELNNKCPNCGGNFERRPVRTPKALLKHPASSERVHQNKSASDLD